MIVPQIVPLNFSYRKLDTAVAVLNFDDIPIDKTAIKDQQIVYLGPESVGGNHKHARTEWFVGFGDLIFVWLDENNQPQTVEMQPEGKLTLITVPPFLPHAVVNRSKTQSAVLWELADNKMENVVRVQVF